MLFPSEGELKRLFDTTGVFYELETDDQRELCRSVLSIRRKGTVTDRAEALFVLTNPGKCLPVDQAVTFPVDPVDISAISYLEAEPDHTLYQLMRLMERLNWNFVEVINLSDLRSGRIEEFQEKLHLMKEHGDDRHSVFSLQRRGELENRIASADRVIAGWGTNAAIRQPASEALAVLSSICQVKGLAHEHQPYFYHPFPRMHTKCMEWLDGMVNQLEGDMEPA